MKLKIVDLEVIHPHAIMVSLGEANINDYWGDDWDDVPFEHNAGPVYERFVSKTIIARTDSQHEMAWIGNEFLNSPYSKENFKDNIIPALLITKNNCLVDALSFNTVVVVEEGKADIESDNKKLVLPGRVLEGYATHTWNGLD